MQIIIWFYKYAIQFVFGSVFEECEKLEVFEKQRLFSLNDVFGI